MSEARVARCRLARCTRSLRARLRWLRARVGRGRRTEVGVYSCRGYEQYLAQRGGGGGGGEGGVSPREGGRTQGKVATSKEVGEYHGKGECQGSREEDHQVRGGGEHQMIGGGEHQGEGGGEHQRRGGPRRGHTSYPRRPEDLTRPSLDVTLQENVLPSILP